MKNILTNKCKSIQCFIARLFDFMVCVADYEFTFIVKCHNSIKWMSFWHGHNSINNFLISLEISLVLFRISYNLIISNINPYSFSHFVWPCILPKCNVTLHFDFAFKFWYCWMYSVNTWSLMAFRALLKPNTLSANRDPLIHKLSSLSISLLPSGGF